MADTGLRQGRKLIYHTAAVADGDFSTASATDLGFLADGSDTPEAEDGTFETAGGNLAAGVDLTHTYRTTDATAIATLLTAKKAGTQVYFFITAMDAESYRQIGPGVISSCKATSSKYGAADKKGLMITFNVKDAYADEVDQDLVFAVTLP